MKDIFAALYELITGQGNNLAQLLYNEETYIPVGISMLLLSFISMAIYYFAINHPRFNRWFHWLIVVLIVCLINFAIAYFMADGVVYNTYGTVDNYVTQIINFAIANAIWTFIFSFIFSMIIKWKSSNAKHSPF